MTATLRANSFARMKKRNFANLTFAKFHFIINFTNKSFARDNEWRYVWLFAKKTFVNFDITFLRSWQKLFQKKALIVVIFCGKIFKQDETFSGAFLHCIPVYQTVPQLSSSGIHVLYAVSKTALVNFQ